MKQETLTLIYAIAAAILFVAAIVGWARFFLIRKQWREQGQEIIAKDEEIKNMDYRISELLSFMQPKRPESYEIGPYVSPKVIQERLVLLENKESKHLSDNDIEIVGDFLQRMYLLMFAVFLRSDKPYFDNLTDFNAKFIDFKKYHFMMRSMDDIMLGLHLKDYLKSSILEEEKNYARLNRMYKTFSETKLFSNYQNDWEPEIKRKAFEISEKDMTAVREKIYGYSVNFPQAEGDWERLPEFIQSAVEITQRSMVSKDKQDELKSLLIDQFNTAVEKMKTHATTSHQIKIAANMRELFEKTFPAVEQPAG